MLSEMTIYGAGTGTSSDTAAEITYEYDNLYRMTEKVKEWNNSLTMRETYTFADKTSKATTRVGSFTSTVGTTSSSYTYTYDSFGNIQTITDSAGLVTRYYYDDQQQLIRENNPYTNTTYVYTYDRGGNRTSKTTYTYTTGSLSDLTGTTTNYTYEGDRLTAIGSTAITYDDLGNPLTYGTAAYNWQNGRQLASINYNGGDPEYLFEYNDSGIRTSKEVNGVKHVYTLNGSQIATESWIQNGVEYYIIYLYDESGAPIGMQYRQSSMAEGLFYTFFFEKNLFGDIVAIYNEYGVKVLSYSYDAWGNVTQTWHNMMAQNLYANYNPFRYRGYYYDTETGLYYLQSRYYDPATGRFLNADAYINANGDLIGFNMYAYCSNNPVMRVDHCGTNWISNVWEAINQFFSENFGAAVNVGKETSDKRWLGLITVEAGRGYSKSFDTGKPINVYVSTGDEWFDFDEYSAGFDINFNGYGANIEIGSDTSAGIHLNNISVDYGMDISGHSYYQFTSELGSGGYTYTKISLNHLECAVVVLVAVYAPYLLPALAPAMGNA